MPLIGRFNLGKNRVLLAGEAAGFMNIFGEGISSALATGHLAAAAICRARESGQDALTIYSDLAEHEKQATFKSWESAKMLKNRFGERQAP
jgi:flavin-dependent dehydrogenase